MSIELGATHTKINLRKMLEPSQMGEMVAVPQYTFHPSIVLKNLAFNHLESIIKGKPTKASMPVTHVQLIGDASPYQISDGMCYLEVFDKGGEGSVFEGIRTSLNRTAIKGKLTTVLMAY